MSRRVYFVFGILVGALLAGVACAIVEMGR